MKITIKKTIRINGKVYDRLEDVPAALRDAYRQAKAAGAAAATEQAANAATPADPAPLVTTVGGALRWRLWTALSLAALAALYVLRHR